MKGDEVVEVGKERTYLNLFLYILWDNKFCTIYNIRVYGFKS